MCVREGGEYDHDNMNTLEVNTPLTKLKEKCWEGGLVKRHSIALYLHLPGHGGQSPHENAVLIAVLQYKRLRNDAVPTAADSTISLARGIEHYSSPG